MRLSQKYKFSHATVMTTGHLGAAISVGDDTFFAVSEFHDIIARDPERTDEHETVPAAAITLMPS